MLAVGNDTGEPIWNLPSAAAASGLIRGVGVGVGVGSDLTMRARQARFKELRQPWDDSMGLDDSAPISRLVENEGGGGEGRWWFGEDAEIELRYDGEVRQKATVQEMIWKPQETIAWLSQTHDLMDGDVIMMGTPAGVGPVVPGGEVKITLKGGGRLRATLRSRLTRTVLTKKHNQFAISTPSLPLDPLPLVEPSNRVLVLLPLGVRERVVPAPVLPVRVRAVLDERHHRV